MNRRSQVKRAIIVLIVLACIIAIIGGTYARYSSKGTANAKVDIAKWSIKLGTEDISTQSKTVNANVTYSDNEYVANGKIAPGRSATFSVEVDPTGSEVAIDYTFTVDPTTIASSLIETNGSKANIAVTGAVCTVGGNPATVTNTTVEGKQVFSVSQDLASVQAGNKVVVTFTATWTNNDTDTAIDTAEGVASSASESGKSITVPVNVTAQQKI